jgi:hypothetical protein
MVVTMHPIERLRSVARASSVSPAIAVREAAAAMAVFAHDHHALVTACRRLVDRHPTAAPLWWFGARMLTASDPRVEAQRLVDEIGGDPTARALAHALADGATVCVIGWPELAGQALVRRGDISVLAIDAHGQGSRFASRLHQHDVDAVDVPPEGLGAAVPVCDLVLLEASGVGPTECLAVPGSRAAAAVAHHAGVPVWCIAGVGRMLPRQLWDALVTRAGIGDEPWDADAEIVPLDLVDRLAVPEGVVTTAEALGRVSCPVATELLVDRRDID